MPKTVDSITQKGRTFDMKKRLCVLLLGMVLFTESFINVWAKENDKTQETITTGTQTGAMEEQKDVDADIKDDIDALIPKDIEEITISSAEDFLKFAENCKLDTWSVNKKVVRKKTVKKEIVKNSKWFLS